MTIMIIDLVQTPAKYDVGEMTDPALAAAGILKGHIPRQIGQFVYPSYISQKL